MGNLAEGEFGCQYCGGRGDLHWLVVHSHRRRGKTSRFMEALWSIGCRARGRTGWGACAVTALTVVLSCLVARYRCAWRRTRERAA